MLPVRPARFRAIGGSPLPVRDLRPIREADAMAKDPAPMRSPSEPRLSFEAPIYEMEARLSEMEAQYAKNRAAATRPRSPSRSAACGASWPRSKREIYSNLDPWQTVQVSRHPAATADPRLHRFDLRPVHRAARRPRVWRRPGDRHGARPHRRHQGHVHRPSKGKEPRRAQGLPFRLCSSRGLSQGAQEDAVRRPSSACRSSRSSTRRRLSGNRRRGTRPGRDHRREPAWP